MSPRILSLDPSSTCIGYAMFTGEGVLYEHGRLTPPNKAKDGYARVACMVSELVELISLLRASLHPETPIVVIVETTKGHMHAGRKGGGAGMTIYGMAMGFVIGRLSAMADVDVRLVPVETWTRGTPKAKRQAQVAVIHKSYDVTTDPGGDAADAIGLGEWWLMSQKVERAKAREARTK